MPPWALFGAGGTLAAAAAGWGCLRAGAGGWAAWFAAVNLATLLLYGWDKAASRAGWLRVPEIVLHVFALAGGTPAALAGMWLFRHKTVKRSFRLVFWLIVACQGALIAWLLWRHVSQGRPPAA